MRTGRAAFIALLEREVDVVTVYVKRGFVFGASPHRPAQAPRPGRVARRDGEYQRCGTANLFCGVEPKAGRHFPKVTANRSSPEFADYLLEIAERYPAADTIHLVLDNLSSHTRKAVVERFGEEAGSWLWK